MSLNELYLQDKQSRTFNSETLYRDSEELKIESDTFPRQVNSDGCLLTDEELFKRFEQLDHDFLMQTQSDEDEENCPLFRDLPFIGDQDL